MGKKYGQKKIIALYIILMLAAVSTCYGWKIFWFLTDDAYISFRYISNSMFGYGYVWNPPPFRPVEGYTSFLWVVLLDGIWRLLGLHPPDSANYISLCFSLLVLLLGGLMVFNLNIGEKLQKYRVILLGLVFLGVVTNRTFLAWTSSGLETAMFNFFLTLWIFCCLFLPVYSRQWLFGITLSAALCYLSRPDGLLIALTSGCLVSFALYSKKDASPLSIKQLSTILPLLLIPLHLVWRRSFYGEWLPNTYYAKTISGQIWPKSGIQYLLSFIMEYSLWVWFILLILLIIVKLKSSGLLSPIAYVLALDLKQILSEPCAKAPDMKVIRGSGMRGIVLIPLIFFIGLLLCVRGHLLLGGGLIGVIITGLFLLGIFECSLIEVMVIVTVLIHSFYYTIVIGGDHFEYRVYSHLILLLCISFIWLLNRLRIDFKLSIILFCLFIILSWPIPWLHWQITHNIECDENTPPLKASVAQALRDRAPFTPAFLLSYLEIYDRMQGWLIDHAVCRRHQEHKWLHLFLVNHLPLREEGLLLPSENYPVLNLVSVGIVSWVLPKIFIIDAMGLNDYVIARNQNIDHFRMMAHERRPPPGYIECFSPNVKFSANTWYGKRVIINKRKVPLTPEKIIECEGCYAGGATQGKQ